MNHKLKVGDLVTSSGNRNADSRWSIVEITNDSFVLRFETEGSHKGTMHKVALYDWQMLTVVGHLTCDHDWKRITMFRFDEFHCEKCKTSRPFDIEKDVA